MPSFDYDITTAPFTQVVPQAVFNVGNQVIFRFTSATKTMLGARTNSGGTFTPRLSVLANDGSTVLYAAQPGLGGHNWPMLTPDTYYVKVVRNGGGASNFDFTFFFDIFALDSFTIEDGDLLVNDDNAGLPATLTAADGTLKSYVSSVPAGEIGAILPTRVSAWYDAFSKYDATNRIALVDADLIYLTSVSVGDTSQPNILAGRTKFWVIVSHTDGGGTFDHLWTVTAAGVATDTGYAFPVGAKVWVGAVNVDETILYWARKTNAGGVISALDLNTLTPLADLYTIPTFVTNTDEIADTPNNKPGDMHVLLDGSIVTWWYDVSADTDHVLHISAAGALLHDIALSAGTEYVDHLGIVYGQSAGVLIWLFNEDFGTTGRFGFLTFATGLITDDFTKTLFEQGYNQADEPDLFGISTSCTVVTFSPSDNSEAGGGGGDNGGGGGDDDDLPGPGDIDVETIAIRWLRRAPHKRAA